MARKPVPRAKPAAKSAAGLVNSQTPILEWISAGVGLVLLMGVLVVIGQEAFLGDSSPPKVFVERIDAQAIPGGHLLRIRARNAGGAVASQVMIEGELTLPGRPPETAEVTFDYLPDHSSREGGLFFEGDPDAGVLTLRAKGYVKP